MSSDSSNPSTPGGDFLAKKGRLTKGRAVFASLKDILVVEDETFDSDRMQATLHTLLGYDVEIRIARTIGNALDAIIERQPEIVLLDDILKPNDSATLTVPFLRRAGYQGPIVVVSGQVTRQRRAELIKAGCVDVIHKDDVNTVRLMEALAQVFGAAQGTDK